MYSLITEGRLAERPVYGESSFKYGICKLAKMH
jgi:hypothetical protein